MTKQCPQWLTVGLAWMSFAVMLGVTTVLADSVELTRIDGTTNRCALVKVGPDGVTVQCDAVDAKVQPERTPAESKIAWDEIAEIRLQPVAAPEGDPWPSTVFLASGGRLPATMTQSAEESIRADTSIAAGLTIPFSAASGIWFGGDTATSQARELFDDMLANRLAGKDVLLMQRDGKPTTIRGSVLALGPDGGRFRFRRKEFDFKRTALLGIAFAAGVDAPPTLPVHARCIDGSEIAGRVVEGDGNGLILQPGWETRIPLPFSKLASLSVVSDRIVYVSALDPIKNESAGLLHAPFTARFDRNVANRTIAIAGRSFERGIGVHARSELTYALDGRYETFAATIGIDDAVRPRGNVVFQIDGDGNTLFDSGPVTGRDAARNIVVDVRGVDQLTLTVDYGEDLDLSDHADWASARLIKPRSGD